MSTVIPSEAPYAAEVLSGVGPAVHRLRLQIARIAPHFRIALLTGEPGTGKHIVARELHRLSPAASRPFRTHHAVNLPALDPGATTYLHGLEALPPAAQTSLLQALQSAPRDTRIILAAACDLRGMVAAGRMNPALYDTLNTLAIRLPPLRERLDDLPDLAQAILHRFSPPASFTPAAIARLRQHPWPANLLELHALCQRLAPLARPLTPDDLQLSAPSVSPTLRLEEVVHRHVKDVLQSCSGNKLRAAELLGISRSTLYRMLEARPTHSQML